MIFASILLILGFISLVFSFLFFLVFDVMIVGIILIGVSIALLLYSIIYFYYLFIKKEEEEKRRQELHLKVYEEFKKLGLKERRHK
jgi:predicted RND superfamily exporter protein